jgi:2-iminoacetate synthase
MPSIAEVQTARETAQQIISEPDITEALEGAKAPDSARLEDILAHAREREGLSLGEVAQLTHITDPAATEALFETAAAVKQQIYGDRVVLFAPLYVSNECVGNCLYCAFRTDNDLLERRTLDAQDIHGEVEWLVNQGYRRLLLVFGEHPHNDVYAMARAVEAVYATHTPKGEIRRVNINAAPLTAEGFRTLQPAGIGTYQVFQETYHRETYRVAHPVGPKADYDWRLSVWDRCYPAGIDDMGLGVLFGLYDWRWELLALLQHAAYLDKAYGVGPHTISVPRLEPAYNAPFASSPPQRVSDEEFKRLIAIVRLAVPYTGMILSTRESAQMRNECMRLGISQISAGSSVSPGGYTERNPDEEDAAQFVVGDHRNLDTIMHDLCDLGYLPSFCTACYRSGRTGQDFMALAKPGEIHHFCLPNAVLTFKEYLLDSASPETRAAGEKAIAANLALIEEPAVRAQTEAKLAELEAGKRDAYF